MTPQLLRPQLRIHYRIALAFLAVVAAAIAGNYLMAAICGEPRQLAPMHYPSRECVQTGRNWAVCAYEGPGVR